jgi:hypothetical protein
MSIYGLVSVPSLNSNSRLFKFLVRRKRGRGSRGKFRDQNVGLTQNE